MCKYPHYSTYMETTGESKKSNITVTFFFFFFKMDLFKLANSMVYEGTRGEVRRVARCAYVTITAQDDQLMEER
jgi:hypothetical protein